MTLRNRHRRDCASGSDRPDTLLMPNGTRPDGFNGKVEVSKGEDHRSLDESGAHQKCCNLSDFCEGKIKGDASRAPLMPDCTRVYRTSNLFLAPRVIGEKP